MALGGVHDDALERDFLRPALKLAIANIVRSNASNTDHQITEAGLMNSIDLADIFGASIINWSVESRGKMRLVEQHLARRNPLVVIAAGNSGAFLDAIGGFPASFLQDTPTANAIVVGAHGPDPDPDNTMLEWSNFGPRTVNLLAPGCRVDTLGPNGRAPVDGTSFAAPLVTFTGALLAAQGITKPKQIKIRILSTVDLDHRLASWVGSAGRLNIAKALAIHRDVIELRGDGDTPDPASGMRLGTITWETSTLSICDATVEVKDLVRLAPYFSPDLERPMLAEWMEFDLTGRPTFVRRECPRTDAAFRFVATDGTDKRLFIADIKDFVAKRH